MNLYPGCAHADAYDDFTDQYMSIVINYFLERLDLLPPEVSS